MPKQKKNGFCRFLIHADKISWDGNENRIYEKRQEEQKIYSTPEEIRSMRLTDKLRNAGISGDDSATKRLANKRWYEKNKEWKKNYNAKYYQENKEYWQEYYSNAKKNLDIRSTYANETKQTLQDVLSTWDKSSPAYKQALEIANNRAANNEQWRKEAEQEFKAAKENLDRAMDDYTWAKNTYGRTSVSTLWNTGAKQVIDTGKSFLSNWKSGLNTLTSSLKSLFR